MDTVIITITTGTVILVMKICLITLIFMGIAFFFFNIIKQKKGSYISLDKKPTIKINFTTAEINTFFGKAVNQVKQNKRQQEKEAKKINDLFGKAQKIHELNKKTEKE